ncbi:MAG: class I SAM-dependent methyltransferase [Verrucomicrobiales bacterium]|nr:class I SAM-dependent methyltransferase [Verrucomicrobiales bacterium]
MTEIQVAKKDSLLVRLLVHDPQQYLVMPYEFTTDWFSAREPIWAELFDELRHRPACGLEIGSYEGRSAVWILEHLLVHRQSTLTCIDFFQNSEVNDRFDSNINASGAREKVTKLTGFSWQHLRSLQPDSFDLIYVDGSHLGRDVLEDAVLAFRLLRKGGFLAFDDYLWKDDPSHSVYPKEAIDAFLHLYGESVDVLHKNWQVIVRKVSH